MRCYSENEYGWIDLWWKFLPAVSGGIRSGWIQVTDPTCHSYTVIFPTHNFICPIFTSSLSSSYICRLLSLTQAHIRIANRRIAGNNGLWSNRNCVWLPFYWHHFLPSQEVFSECEQKVVERNLSADFLIIMLQYTLTHTRWPNESTSLLVFVVQPAVLF